MTEEAAMANESIAFPMVALVEGGVTSDGQQVLLQLVTVDDGPIHFGLRLADMESFITFLLQMAASLGLPQRTEDRGRYQPIPISGISAGEFTDGKGLIGVTVGGTELMFQIPTAAIAEVARTLMMVGVDERAQRPS
jgi:hypothetical protein